MQSKTVRLAPLRTIAVGVVRRSDGAYVFRQSKNVFILCRVSLNRLPRPFAGRGAASQARETVKLILLPVVSFCPVV